MGRPTVSVDSALSRADFRAGEKEGGRQWAENEQTSLVCPTCRKNAPATPPSMQQVRPLLPSAAPSGSPQQEHQVKQLLFLTPFSSVGNECFLSALPSSTYASAPTTSPMEGKAMCAHHIQGKLTLLPLCGLDSHRYAELGFGPSVTLQPLVSWVSNFY